MKPCRMAGFPYSRTSDPEMGLAKGVTAVTPFCLSVTVRYCTVPERRDGSSKKICKYFSKYVTRKRKKRTTGVKNK